MPAVVRIKRRIDEEPHTAFVLNGKRRRIHNDENADASAGPPLTDNKEELSHVLLKFAGTIDKQDDSATKQFAAARLNKETAKEMVELRQTNDASIASALRRDKQRQETQRTAKEQRYRVVNCLRTTLNDNDEVAAIPGCSKDAALTDNTQITIVDIESQQQTQQPSQQDEQDEQQPLQQDQQQPADSDVGYVYDLYVPDNEMQASYVDLMDDNYLSLRPVDEINLEDCYDDDNEDYDSADSNQEDYYTNDYPDEEDVAGSDDELTRKMNKFMLDDDDDDDEFVTGSSDDEDHNKFYDPYVHTVDTEAESFVDDIDYYNPYRRSGSFKGYMHRFLPESEQAGFYSSDEDDVDVDNLRYDRVKKN